MPVVPKPSKVKEASTSKTKSGYGRKKPAAPKAQKSPRVVTGGTSHTPPKGGKTGKWLEEIKETGGITKLEIIEGCAPRDLKASMHIAVRAYCRQLGLLKD